MDPTIDNLICISLPTERGEKKERSLQISDNTKHDAQTTPQKLQEQCFHKKGNKRNARTDPKT
jgi:hypothetical protein